MAEAPTQAIEDKIRDLLNYIWATTGEIAPDKFTLGVDWEGWKELGGTPKILSLTCHMSGVNYEVVPVPGLPTGSVALIWK